MIRDLTVVCIIPARLASTRLPEKILYPINGKALLEHTWRAAMSIPEFDKVIIALDSPVVAQLVESFGGSYIYTDPTCPSGTHRMMQAIDSSSDLTADIWVNWQADVPLPSQTMIPDLLQSAQNTKHPHVWTLKTPITSPAEISHPDTVKVVTGQNDHALYFSRSPIPYYQDQYQGDRIYYKHVGLYAFTTAALTAIKAADDPHLATIESLEQLQFLTAGIPITAHTTDHAIHSVDNLQDIATVAQVL